LNKHVWSRRNMDATNAKQRHKSLILSVGQIVPHEVLGMANFNKNLFVGVGGVEGKSLIIHQLVYFYAVFNQHLN
jgi:hypothetical protein